MKNILIVLLIFACVKVYGQKELSGREISERLTIIEQHFINERFEEAISIFYSQDELIKENNVRRRDVQLFSKLKEDIRSKKELFDQNNRLINSWFTLKSEANYEELQKEFRQLNTSHLYTTDKRRIEELTSFLNSWNREYSNTLDKYVTNPKRYLNNRFSGVGDYKSAERKLDEIKNILLIFEHIEYPDGHIPELRRQIELSKANLLREQGLIEDFIEKNRPLSLQEVNQILSNRNVTISDIKNHANHVNLRMDRIDHIIVRLPDYSNKRITLNELAAIIETDVVRYFGLHNTYNSELKRSVFMETEDYKGLRDELTAIREYVINSYFYIPIRISCYDKYDLSSKTFKYSTSTLDGFFYSTNYLQYGDLCIRKPNNFRYEERTTFGGSNYFFTQRYSVPVPNPSNALKIEENCNHSMQMYLFKLDNTATKRNALGFNSTFVLASPSQYIIFNNNNGEIYQKHFYR